MVGLPLSLPITSISFAVGTVLERLSLVRTFSQELYCLLGDLSHRQVGNLGYGLLPISRASFSCLYACGSLELLNANTTARTAIAPSRFYLAVKGAEVELFLDQIPQQRYSWMSIQ